MAVGEGIRKTGRRSSSPITEPDATVASVARQVGHGSAFVLSAAFKRVRGVSPADHRTLARAEPLR